MRISRAVMMMEIAKTVAKRSTCYRLNVGAVAVIQDRIVSIGYNGTAPGEAHCAGDECAGRFGCQLTTHAERNAVDYIPAALRGVPFDLYVTDSPCTECANYLIEKGAARVFYATPYRIIHGLECLVNAGVKVYRVMPSGYVTDELGRIVPELMG